MTALTTFHGDLIAAGLIVDFTLPTPQESLWVARWDGTTWRQLGPKGVGANGEMASALCVYQDRLYFAGKFDHFGNTETNSVASWDGSSWRPVGGGLFAPISDLYVYNGQLLAGGYFGYIDDWQHTTGWRAWDGSSWNQPPSLAGEITAFGDYRSALVAYWVYHVPTEDSVSVRLWDGSSWKALGTHRTPPGWGKRLLTFDGDLIVCGLGVTEEIPSGVVRYDGTSWRAMGRVVDDGVLDVAVYNGNLIATGYFRQADGKDVNGIARWDGSHWQPLENPYGLGRGLDGYGTSLAVWDGALIVGGAFHTVGSDQDSAGYIARWDE